METFLIRALQLIMSLSLLVIIHEGGHFLFSRLFKVRVEKFYIFFDPWFSLFKFKPKNSDTEYGIGWVPLGGYVKISGMIDESMDTEQMKQPAKPWEFRSKPAWQRHSQSNGSPTERYSFQERTTPPGSGNPPQYS